MGRNRTSFAPGNLAALRHGSRSARVRETRRRELLDEMRGLIMRALGDDIDAGTLLRVDLAAVQAADVRQLHDYVNGQGGPVSTKGNVYKAVEVMRARERDLAHSLTELGIGPRARAQIVGSLGGLRKAGPAHQLAAKRLELERAAGKAS